MSTHSNPDHHAEKRRIKRIIGQLEGIQRMIEERRYCIEILNQTKAISSAIHSLETALLEKHISHCVAEAFSSDEERDQKMKELLNLFKKRLT